MRGATTRSSAVAVGRRGAAGDRPRRPATKRRFGRLQRRRKRNSQGGATATGDVRGNGGGGSRSVLGRMDLQHLATPALEDDGPPKQASNTGDQRAKVRPCKGDLFEARLDEGCLVLELGALIDEEPDRTALELLCVHRTDIDRRDPGAGNRLPERRESGVGSAAVAGRNEEDAGAAPGEERVDQDPGLRLGRGDRHERRTGDDRDVTRVEGVECRDTRLEDADPARRSAVAAARRSGCRPGPIGEPAGAMALQSSLKVATADDDQVDGAGGAAVGAAEDASRPGDRWATRSSSSRPNSRSKST